MLIYSGINSNLELSIYLYLKCISLTTKLLDKKKDFSIKMDK
jgi:hypothetical protein